VSGFDVLAGNVFFCPVGMGWKLIFLFIFQVAGSVLAFVIRYGLAGLVYDGDRR
jgi:hypothetical protein